MGIAVRRRFIEFQFGRRLEVLAGHDGTSLCGNYIRLGADGVPESEIAEVTAPAQTLAAP